MKRFCTSPVGVSFRLLPPAHPPHRQGEADGLHLVGLILRSFGQAFGEAQEILLVLGTHNLVAVMPELHGKSAKVRQEAHDQSPLDPGRIHVDALGHEDEIWGAAVKERTPISRIETGLFSGQGQVTRTLALPLTSRTRLAELATCTNNSNSQCRALPSCGTGVWGLA